jgi:gamma-glutamyltranspeptidase/glutathione hydrolase
VLIRTAQGELAAIDGTTEVPLAYTGGATDDEGAYGYETIAVAGTVAALAEVLRAHGTWPLERAMRPAIALAADGFTLSAAEARRIASVHDRLASFEGSRTAFLRPDGSTYEGGDHFWQLDLAATLRTIAQQGPDAFYRGDIARRIAADIAAHAGYVTEADLEAYSAASSIVVRGRYRGHDLIGSYLPASGATTIGILQIMDRFDLARAAGTADWVSIVAQALLAGFADREADVTPAARKAEWLVSAALADQRAAELRAPAALRIAPARDTPPAHEPATTGHSMRSATRGRAGRVAQEPAHTTHVSVADRAGNVVALTQSIGPTMGSKVVTPGLGFVHAATMGYLGALEPGTRRHWSSQSPLLIVKDDEPVWVLGGAGARRILSAMVESVSRAIDEGRAPADAIAAPRFHPTPSRIDMEVRDGTAWPADVITALRSLGIHVETRDDAPYFARINAIHRAADGLLTGIADARWQGAAAGPSR